MEEAGMRRKRLGLMGAKEGRAGLLMSTYRPTWPPGNPSIALYEEGSLESFRE
jgi:hypothetical protein